MGQVFWFAGLSGSGKTTLAHKAKEYLIANPKVFPHINKWQLVDGDVIREFLQLEIGYSFSDRRKSVNIMGLLALYLAKNEIGVIVANISPFHDLRLNFRRTIPNYHEIYCRCSIAACISRDPKGHYQKQLDEGIENFIGLDIPFQEPENPDLILDTELESIEECAGKLYAFFEKISKREAEQ